MLKGCIKRLIAISHIKMHLFYTTGYDHVTMGVRKILQGSRSQTSHHLHLHLCAYIPGLNVAVGLIVGDTAAEIKQY